MSTSVTKQHKLFDIVCVFSFQTVAMFEDDSQQKNDDFVLICISCDGDVVSHVVTMLFNCSDSSLHK